MTKKNKKPTMKLNKKKKLKLPAIIIIVVIILLIIIVGIILFLNKSKVIIKYNNNKININSKTYNTDIVKDIKNGTIVSKKEQIDTTKTGKKKITIKVKDKFNKVKKYTYEISIIDKEKPTITAEDKITIEQGTEIDLLQNVVVEDNSKEEITPTIEGTYDINTPGTYELKYVAIDSNKNKATKNFTLEVIEKQNNNTSNENRSYKTRKGYTINVVDGISYIDGIMIVNKSYPVPSSYNPGGLTSEFNNAFSSMQQAAQADGIGIWVISGFRSYNTQNTLYNNYAARDGYAAADTYSARPGHSEHQTGLAADINVIDDDFGETPEGKWLNDNAWKYGFILRYTKDGVGETGYKYEPWHFRYVGTDLATKLYNNGNWITMENYYGITSQYS